MPVFSESKWTCKIVLHTIFGLISVNPTFSAVGRIIALLNVHVLIPGIWEYVSVTWQGEIKVVNRIKIADQMTSTGWEFMLVYPDERV